MKFSFIQGCKEKFFQRRNICAQIGYNNKCVCRGGGVCTYRERKYEVRKNAKCISGVMDCQGMGEKPSGPLAQIMKNV